MNHFLISKSALTDAQQWSAPSLPYRAGSLNREEKTKEFHHSSHIFLQQFYTSYKSDSHGEEFHVSVVLRQNNQGYYTISFALQFYHFHSLCMSHFHQSPVVLVQMKYAEGVYQQDSRHTYISLKLACPTSSQNTISGPGPSS